MLTSVFCLSAFAEDEYERDYPDYKTFQTMINTRPDSFENHNFDSYALCFTRYNRGIMLLLWDSNETLMRWSSGQFNPVTANNSENGDFVLKLYEWNYETSLWEESETVTGNSYIYSSGSDFVIYCNIDLHSYNNSGNIVSTRPAGMSPEYLQALESDASLGYHNFNYVVNNVGKVFNSSIEMTNSVTSTILKTPLLLLFCIIPIIGLGIGLFMRLKDSR